MGCVILLNICDRVVCFDLGGVRIFICVMDGNNMVWLCKSVMVLCFLDIWIVILFVKIKFDIVKCCYGLDNF